MALKKIKESQREKSAKTPIKNKLGLYTTFEI